MSIGQAEEDSSAPAKRRSSLDDPEGDGEQWALEVEEEEEDEEGPKAENKELFSFQDAQRQAKVAEAARRANKRAQECARETVWDHKVRKLSDRADFVEVPALAGALWVCV